MVPSFSCESPVSFPEELWRWVFGILRKCCIPIVSLEGMPSICPTRAARKPSGASCFDLFHLISVASSRSTACFVFSLLAFWTAGWVHNAELLPYAYRAYEVLSLLILLRVRGDRDSVQSFSQSEALRSYRGYESSKIQWWIFVSDLYRHQWGSSASCRYMRMQKYIPIFTSLLLEHARDGARWYRLFSAWCRWSRHEGDLQECYSCSYRRWYFAWGYAFSSVQMYREDAHATHRIDSVPLRIRRFLIPSR